MAVTVEGLHQSSLHPLHAIILAGTVPLFLGVLLSDSLTSKLRSAVEEFRFLADHRGSRVRRLRAAVVAYRIVPHGSSSTAGRPFTLFFCSQPGMLGFINALIHAKDAWASMPEGLVLSAIVAALAIAATAIGFSPARGGLE